MQICVTGLSHKTAPVEVREALAVEPEDYPRVLADVATRPALAELTLLSTCNRTELYAVTDSYHAGRHALEEALAEMGRKAGADLTPYLYHRHGPAAVRHLFRVSSSLDSMVVGEPQILGQVKDAYRAAAECGKTRLVLDRLFPHAFEVGKRVRSETAIGAYAVSVSSAAVGLAKKIFGDLESRHALVVGAGEMAELTLRHLHDSGVRDIVLANRTREHAQALADEYRAQVTGLDGIAEALGRSDIVIASAASPEPLIHRPAVEAAMRERKGRPIFLIDIAVPRNVDADVAHVYNVFLYDVDDLERVVEGNRARRVHEAERAEAIVEQELQRFLRWWEGLDTVPTVVALRTKMEKLQEEETRRLLARLPHLAERDRKLIEQFGVTLVHKILHDPTSQIRNVEDAERCSALAASLRYLFQLQDPARPTAGPSSDEAREDDEAPRRARGSGDSA